MEAGLEACRPRWMSRPPPRSPAPQEPDLHTHGNISHWGKENPANGTFTTRNLCCVCLYMCVCVHELTGFVLVIIDVNIVGLHNHKAFTHQSGWSVRSHKVTV